MEMMTEGMMLLVRDCVFRCESSADAREKSPPLVANILRLNRTMDKFVVDLDQILDDLEAQEAQFVPQHCSERRLTISDDSSPQTPIQDNENAVITNNLTTSSFLTRDNSPPDSKNREPSDCVQEKGEQNQTWRPDYDVMDGKMTGSESCLTNSHPSHCSSPHKSPSPEPGLEACNAAKTYHERTDGDKTCPTESASDIQDESRDVSPQITNGAHQSDPLLVRSDGLSVCPPDSPDILSDGTEEVRSERVDDDVTLAKVIEDVEEYGKTLGTTSTNDGGHVFEDEELKRIMESIDDWGRRSSESALVPDEDIESEEGYDEDLANLTNGIVSHSSSLRPVKEIGHKSRSLESPVSPAVVHSVLLPNSGSSNDHHPPSSSQCLRFADCRVDSDDPDDEQMNEYLQDVRLSPHAIEATDARQSSPAVGMTVAEESSNACQSPAETQEPEETPVPRDRPVRPSSLDLNCEPLAPATGDQVPVPTVNHSPHEDGVRVGHHKPFWIPDEEAPICMHCDTRFTVIKRRHHCRACGKVLCATCCNMRAKLAYMDFRETRVCSICYPLLVDEGQESSASAPDPSNPSEYCSTIPPDQQVGSDAAAPPLTVFVPVGVLKRADRPPRREAKQVVFSDGIRPGCDLRAEVDSEPSSSSAGASGRLLQRLRSPPVEVNGNPLQKHRSKVQRTVVHDANGQLPAVLNCPALAADPTLENLLVIMRREVVTFYLTKNLHVHLKLVRLECCAKLDAWSFASKGLATVGQDEVAVILERVDEEQTIPRDVFRLITSVYDSSSKGLVHSEMSHILFPDGLFGFKDNCCFLFVRRTLQCIQNLVLPSPPFLMAVLIQRFEVPWAKVFPLRLVLRLGAEFGSYPCPILSYRQRKAVYCEVGHTILNVLADFRNFQYTIPVIQGVVIQRDYGQKTTTLILPRNRYDSILKILNQNNEHVLALGGNFAEQETDSHYACFQNEEGQYQTYVLSSDGSVIPLQKVDRDAGRIGVSFMVFSGALKSSAGVTAKMSVVEDGVLVQVMPNVIPELKKALRDMKDYDLRIGKVGEDVTDCVSVHWGPDDTCFNVGVVSPIDGRSLSGVPSLRIHNSTDFANKHFLIRWTEVFFLENQDPGRRDSVDPTKVARVIAQSLCRALTLHLDQLVAQGMQKIGLRVSLDPEQVGYEVGSNSQPLPALFVNQLDEALIPVITGNFLSGMDALLVLELFFMIIVK